MRFDTLYVLVHSPLVGGLTWSLVAREMKQRGLDVIVPLLRDTPGSEEPFWKQHTRSVQRALTHIPVSQSIALVGHSGAGPLLPAMRQSIPNHVDAYVFVDASLPRDGASRLDLMKAEDPDWAAGFQQDLEHGARYPTWNADDLREVIPDKGLREQTVAELRPRELSFFSEPIPVFRGWPDAPCIYIQFSAPYEQAAARAREDGWPVHVMEAGHFHMLVDEAAVTDRIVGAVDQSVRKPQLGERKSKIDSVSKTILEVKGAKMVRTSVTFIVIALLTACTGAPTPATDAPALSTETNTQAASTLTAPVESETVTPVRQSPAEPVLQPSEYEIQEFSVPAGSHPHDVAPAPDGAVWYTAQATGELGRLDPATGETHHIALGPNSAPHGVTVGPDGAPWVTDGGLNAIVRVDPQTEEVQVYPLLAGSGYANLNTAVFDPNGTLWFTGQNGMYGRLDPLTGEMQVFEAPRGRGPYGITATPDGSVYYASLAGSHIGRIDPQTNEVEILEPPTPGQGARRVWSDSLGQVWVSEWDAGQVAVYNPVDNFWQEWALPGDGPSAYAVYVDDQDIVWLSDFGANALVRFDPTFEQFTVYEIPSPVAQVRQILGRPGEVWGAESGADKLVVIRTGSQ